MGIRDRSESRDGYAVRVLAVHTSEGVDKPVVDDAAALRDASWWVGSSHAIADNDPGSLLTPAEGCVSYDRASWTLRSGNRWSENIELIAQAGWTRAQWLARPTLLDRCAYWLAVRSKVDRGGGRRIPLVKITAAQYRAGAWGVIGHHDHTVGYSDGTHWDPGPGFPWDVVLDKARAYAAGQTPAAAPVQEDTDMRLIQSTTRGIALIGPGYFRQLSPEDVGVMVRMYGQPVVGNDREFDVARSVALSGEGTPRQVGELHGKVIGSRFGLDGRPGEDVDDMLGHILSIRGALAELASADVDEEALAAALAPKLNGASQGEIAAALREVLTEGVGS